MKIFAYALREYDEKDIFIASCEEAGVEYGYTAEYPSLENAALAEGYEGISIITNPVKPELHLLLQRGSGGLMWMSLHAGL